MIMRAITLTVVGTLFILMCFAAASLGTMLADREVPIQVHSARILTPEVKAGGELRILYKVHRVRTCYQFSDRIMRDTAKLVNRVPLDDIEVKPGSDPVGEDTYISTIPVPANLQPGPAVYTTVTLYRCNLVHYAWPIWIPPREFHFRVVE